MKKLLIALLLLTGCGRGLEGASRDDGGVIRGGDYAGNRAVRGRDYVLAESDEVPDLSVTEPSCGSNQPDDSDDDDEHHRHHKKGHESCR